MNAQRFIARLLHYNSYGKANYDTTVNANRTAYCRTKGTDIREGRTNTCRGRSERPSDGSKVRQDWKRFVFSCKGILQFRRTRAQTSKEGRGSKETQTGKLKTLSYLFFIIFLYMNLLDDYPLYAIKGLCNVWNIHKLIKLGVNN